MNPARCELDPQLRQYRILTIDEDRQNTARIGAALGERFELLTAHNVRDGLQIARSSLPDLILLEVQMPDADGFSACRQLKQDPLTRDIPVIFLTDLESKGDELAGLESGAVDFVTKPIEPVILRARVRTQVELAKTRCQLSHANKQLAGERALISDIIACMRNAQAFCERHIDCVTRSNDQAGGDLVMSARRPNGDQHVLLGDFTGHGLPAAIGTPLVSHLFYSMTEADLCLPHILATINNVLVRQLPANLFMAALAVCLPADDGAVKLWNFGSPDVLHRDACGHWRRLGSQEMPMGIVLYENAYAYRTLRLPAGESLYLMSDGVTETVCDDGRMLGVDRLIACLDRQQLRVGQVLEQLLQCTAPGIELDDIALLKIQRGAHGCTHG